MAELTKWNRHWMPVGAACVVLAAAAIPDPAAADEANPHYVLNAIEDAAYGTNILDGDYSTAIEKIETARRHWVNRFYAANNLCVALIITRDLERAAPVCDDAVDLIRLRTKAIRGGRTSAEYSRLAAVALSNRGVLHALRGDKPAARSDFGAAREFEAWLDAPKINLAKLETASEPSA